MAAPALLVLLTSSTARRHCRIRLGEGEWIGIPLGRSSSSFATQ